MRVSRRASHQIQLSSELRRFAEQFNPLLENFLRERIQNPILRRRVLYAVSLIGVRERAFLVRVSSQLCGVKWKRALPIALAAECFISSALTADDVLDRATTRWKKPTVWKRWGDGQAWLIAELLHALAQVSLDAVEPVVAALPLRSAFRRLLEGQFKEFASSRICSPEETVELAMERTGGLIQACLVAPSLFAASPFRKSLSIFGENLGTALQLADDIFDFVGDPALMGKPTLGDLLNGQPNIVLAHALQQKNSLQRRQVTSWLGKGTERRPNDLIPILRALEKIGSIDYAGDLLNVYVNRAKKALEGFPEGKPKRRLKGFLQVISILPTNHEQL